MMAPCFHRVIKGFMIHLGGDPNTKDETKKRFMGMGGLYPIKAEFNNKSHVRALSMARSGHPDSAGSQFFICHGVRISGSWCTRLSGS